MEVNNDSTKTKDKLSNFYSVGWEKLWAKRLGRKYNCTQGAYRTRLLVTLSLVRDNVKPQKPFRLLDAGCGIGIYTIATLREFPNCRAFAFDVSKEQIDFVNAKLKRLGLSRRADFFVADINEFVLNQPRFDFIFCTEVLEHLPNPIIALTKLRNQGHDETIFIYSVPLIYGSGKAQWFYRQFLTGDKWIETENIAKLNPQNEHYEFYHKQYSRNEIIQLLQEQGFQVLRIRFSNMTFNNKLVMEAYSLLCVLSFYRLDKLVNFITRNRFASQITLECKKSRYEKTIETK